MAFYWLFLWIIVSIILYIYGLQLTNNGKIVKKDCLKKANNECSLYSRKYAVPVGQEVGSQIVTAGIVIGFFVLVGGFGQMILKKKKRNETSY